MKKYISKFISYTVRLENKIAFYPTLLGIGGILFTFIMYFLENKGISAYLTEQTPVLVINNIDTARSLLTTFIAGLISIMVFSFSMVMILLNQASSNFSPRILPGLISNRRHQIVLGIYNGSLLYCIFTLVSIEPTGNEYQLPGFSVLLAIVFMIISLAAFIYFIHSISQEIQIINIMSEITISAKKRLILLIEKEDSQIIEFPKSSNWRIHYAKSTGYLRDIDFPTIGSLLSELKVKMKIIPVKGIYMQKNMPLFKLDKEIDEVYLNQLKTSFSFLNTEFIENNYTLAFKHITEIAIKAMSPGINDPGTALVAIDYLTELFLLRMQKSNKNYYFKKNEPVIAINAIKFNQLLYDVMAPMRVYVKHDVIIVRKLLNMLQYLLLMKNSKDKAYKKAVVKEINSLYKDVKGSLNNDDLKLIKIILKKLQKQNTTAYIIKVA